MELPGPEDAARYPSLSPINPRTNTGRRILLGAPDALTLELIANRARNPSLRHCSETAKTRSASRSGWSPAGVLRPSAAKSTIRARFKSRCNVTGERQRASNILRSFREMRTSLASGVIPILNHDSRSMESGY